MQSRASIHHLSILLLALIYFSTPTEQVTIILSVANRQGHQSSICNNIQPGECCRRLKPFPNRAQQRFINYQKATFEGMTALELGVAWTTDAQNQFNRFAWTSGCGGRVYQTPVSGAGSGDKSIEAPNIPRSLYRGPIHGANFVRFSQQQPQMVAADGIRAFLAGGGQMFTDGRSASSFGDASVAASGGGSSSNTGNGGTNDPEPYSNIDTTNLADEDKASEVADKLAGTKSVYPDVVEMDEIRYLQQGERTSLIYKDEKAGTILDFSTKDPTACIDSWDCDIGNACTSQPQTLDKLLVYGAQLALETIGICKSAVT
ncbi:MAG: hypothetical protein M1812_006572 [Candelaria pacifica]|nr:MAG: hypothetical protein M1812_006572 [Candelaria pacifica]